MTSAVMASPEHFKSPQQLLEELCIETPEELDIEAIAYHCKATIIYRPLEGCAARITGRGDRAIITIDEASPKPRQRFSAGHELGHWMYDRGKVSFSCEANLLIKHWRKDDPESRANRFAADLLLPKTIFEPQARARRAVDFKNVDSLATIFQTSRTATAIRLVECGHLPAMLICYSSAGREWFVAGPEVPKCLWPPSQPDRNSYAFDVLYGEETEHLGEVQATAWFDHRRGEGRYIVEHSVRMNERLILSLLWWKQERMLIEIDNDEERSDHRSDRLWR